MKNLGLAYAVKNRMKKAKMVKGESDHAQHPEGLEDHGDMEGPVMKAYMGNKMASGGMIKNEQPEPEQEMEHHDSIAAAIMAKRAKMHAHIDSGAMDEDTAALSHFATGGEVTTNDHESDDGHADIMLNGSEGPQKAFFNKRNEFAAKENYDDGIMEATEGDEHDDKASKFDKMRMAIMKRKSR